MNLYRAKPNMVEAMEWTGDLNAVAEFIPLMWENLAWGDLDKGDVIVKVGEGLVHFHSRKTFERLYEPVL